MRLCISIPAITATTSCCSLPDRTITTAGGTMIGVAYFPAKVPKMDRVKGRNYT